MAVKMMQTRPSVTDRPIFVDGDEELKLDFMGVLEEEGVEVWEIDLVCM